MKPRITLITLGVDDLEHQGNDQGGKRKSLLAVGQAMGVDHAQILPSRNIDTAASAARAVKAI